eukprot:366551-Chlamydomonas_euryale.AAC.35
MPLVSDPQLLSMLKLALEDLPARSIGVGVRTARAGADKATSLDRAIAAIAVSVYGLAVVASAVAAAARRHTRPVQAPYASYAAPLQQVLATLYICESGERDFRPPPPPFLGAPLPADSALSAPRCPSRARLTTSIYNLQATFTSAPARTRSAVRPQNRSGKPSNARFGGRRKDASCTFRIRAGYGFGSLPREALAAAGFRQVLGRICDEPGAEKLRPLIIQKVLNSKRKREIESDPDNKHEITNHDDEPDIDKMSGGTIESSGVMWNMSDAVFSVSEFGSLQQLRITVQQAPSDTTKDH